MNTLGERINWTMKQKRLERKDLAEALGVSTMAIGDLINNKTKKPRNLLELSEILGVDIKWLQSGEGELPEISTALSNTELVTTQHDGLHRHRIDYLDVRAAAGMSGFENSDYPEIISSLFLTDEGMLQLVGKKSANGICIVNVPTDSMEPTIRKGDIVFIDTKINAYNGDGIYAFTIEGALFIKRVQKLVGGGYRLHSDNKDYDPQDITDDIYQTARFIGRFIRTVHIEAVNL
ncbi:helix-turn-helix transcriptional regulator [Aggregatibacter actinomycetemcomitans]|uniref:XRE family transcriptional regulator n=1 Tax=Aggregatibacter actinomycetemcomitans TaxID=714 RepID=UPI00197BEEF4|nr:helix-turn-helix transcriptional regulator [Aggregatibacter actinomycetemcomitans]MBN6068857.1 helix-turn-helix transcriptional regulator [Aggregatibacter actinomycetemcomitans]MBN6087107.1 helix-turn-helix transcriptional regulator [Aggregatibacter actinomycetemcomitans]